MSPTANDPMRNALEGAAAAVAGVVAMMAVAGLALTLLGAGSVGSLKSMTMAVTAMAVGSSVAAGADMSGSTGSADMSGMMGGMSGMMGGSGGMSMSITGAANAVPLGVTLVGAVVLWLVFARPLRNRRPDSTALLARAAGAAGAAAFALLVVASLGRGTFTLPASAMNGLTGGQGTGGDTTSTESNPMASMMGGATGDTAMSFSVNIGSALLGAVLWVAVVLAIGCLISRKARMPRDGAMDRLRPAWAASLSTVVRTVVIVASVPLVLLAIVGTVAGGRVATAAGAALLLMPNVLAVFLTLGVGGPWTAGAHPVESSGGSSMTDMMSQMMGGGTGTDTGAAGGMAAMQTDRTEQLRSLAAGGMPLWMVALAVTGLVLVLCAYRAARAKNRPRTLPLHPYRGPLARHVGMAERFAIVTAVVMGGSAWLAGISGHFGMSMMGSEMGGMRAELTGSMLRTAVFGLLVGGVAGFLGSLLSAIHRDRVPAAEAAQPVQPHQPKAAKAQRQRAVDARVRTRQGAGQVRQQAGVRAAR